MRYGCLKLKNQLVWAEFEPATFGPIGERITNVSLTPEFSCWFSNTLSSLMGDVAERVLVLAATTLKKVALLIRTLDACGLTFSRKLIY